MSSAAIKNLNVFSAESLNMAELYEQIIAQGYHPQKKLVDDLIKIIPTGSSVLELGCGTGLCLEPLFKAGLTCEGVEKSPEMLAGFKKKKLPVEVHVSDAADFVPTKKYDFIFSCNGPFSIKDDKIESYILEEGHLIASWKRYLKQAGTFLINKGTAKPLVEMKLANGLSVAHLESKYESLVIANNIVKDQGERVVLVKTFVKRRYDLRSIVKKSGTSIVGDTSFFWKFSL